LQWRHVAGGQKWRNMSWPRVGVNVRALLVWELLGGGCGGGSREPTAIRAESFRNARTGTL
jgi:hypothetical protein